LKIVLSAKQSVILIVNWLYFFWNLVCCCFF